MLCTLYIQKMYMPQMGFLLFPTLVTATFANSRVQFVQAIIVRGMFRDDWHA